jgi:hypothetical protein
LRTNDGARIGIFAKQPEKVAQAERQIIRLLKQKGEKKDSTPGADVRKRTWPVVSLPFSVEVLEARGEQGKLDNNREQGTERGEGATRNGSRIELEGQI